MTNEERNALLDEAKKEVWRAIDPSQEGYGRQAAETAMKALDAMKAKSVADQFSQ